MPYNLQLAHTATEFSIQEQSKRSQASSKEKSALVDALLKNKNLLKVNNLEQGFSEQQRRKIEAHLINNIHALLKQVHIQVVYYGNDNKKFHKDSFRFDDPAFYQAKRIIFLKFKLAKGLSEVDLKLATLKSFMLNELLKCRYLEKCDFWAINKPVPFLNPTQSALVQQIIFRNKQYLSKYQVDWPRWMGIVFGVIGLATIFLPGFGIAKGLLSAVLLFVGGVNVGAAISYFRDQFLLKVGYSTLQMLRENKIPDDESIKVALMAGENSKHWKGYCTSFLSWKTYSPQNYPAYVAGLYIGVHRLEDQKQVLKKLRG